MSARGKFPRNRAPCAARAACASMRPLGVCIYAVGSQSCAARRDRLRCARLAAAKLAAHGTSGIRRASDRSRPRTPLAPASRFALRAQGIPCSPRRRSRRLRGVSRRDASSVEYNLLASRRAPPRMRRTASPRVTQLGARPLAALPQISIWCASSARSCAASPLAAPLSVRCEWRGGRCTRAEGVGLAEREARTAKQPQGPACRE